MSLVLVAHSAEAVSGEKCQYLSIEQHDGLFEMNIVIRHGDQITIHYKINIAQSWF